MRHAGRLLLGGRLLLTASGWAVIGAGLGLLLAVAVPLAFGLRPLTVLSGSMEPAIGTGDIVVVERLAPREAHVGDIVTFRDPEQPGRRITHRVRRITAHDGELRFTTKGDANDSVERWSLSQDGELSRVKYHVPLIGYVLSWTRTKFGRLALFVIPLLLLGLYELFRIWRPRREEVAGESAA